MKTILFILLFPFLSFTQDGSGKHFVAGAIISYGTGEIVYYKTKKISIATWTGIGMATVAGASKELIYDKEMKLGNPSFTDAFNTTAGGFLGVIILGCRINLTIP